MCVNLIYLQMWQQYVVHDDQGLNWLECYNFSALCLTRMYVVVICDAYIILDGILGTQYRIVLILVSNIMDRRCC